MQLNRPHSRFHCFEQDGHSKTAIYTGIGASGHSMAKVREKITSPAIIISPNIQPGGLADGNPSTYSIREVPIEQIISHNNQLYIILNECFTGNTLQDYFTQTNLTGHESILGGGTSLSNDLMQTNLSMQKGECLQMLATIIIEHGKQLPPHIHPDHILHGDRGLLLLPGKWSAMLSQYESGQDREQGFEQINYPDVKNHALLELQLYALASSAYFLLSTRWPVEGNDRECQRRLKRIKVQQPIEMLLPEIPGELADWFDRALKLAADDSSPLLRYLQNASKPAEQEDRSRRISAYRKALKRELWWQKITRHRLGIISLLSTFTIIAIIGIASVRTATRDLAITGLSPEQVVRGFYTSYNSLDHNFMAEASHGKAGRQKTIQISSIYAITAVRAGTELRPTFVSAAEWLRKPEGERESLQTHTVFGITQLSLTTQNTALPEESTEEPHFIVSYTLWSPGTEGLQPTEFREELRLREFRRGWKIVAITQLN